MTEAKLPPPDTLRSVRRRRPTTVTGLVAALVLAGGLLLAGSQQLVEQARRAGEIVPAGYAATVAVVFGACGLAQLAAAAGLMLLRRWGWWLGLLAPLLSAAAFWGVRLALVRSSYAQAAWGVEAGLTALALAVMAAILLRPQVRRIYL